MSWNDFEPQRVDVGLFGDLKPLEVLYDFDGPCIFTARLPFGALVLVYLCEDFEETQRLRHIVTTTSARVIERLTLGRIPTHEALTSGSMWLVDTGYDGKPLEAFWVEPGMLPEDALPEPDVMLWAELQPDLVVRLEGEALRGGAWPAEAMASAGEIASKAFKPLYDWAIAQLAGERGQGRPPDWLRRMYGLGAQRVAHGSLELHLVRQRPKPSAQGELFDDEDAARHLEAVHAQAWGALHEGLTWATDPDRKDGPSPDDAKALAVLETLQRIAPSSTGPVEAVRLSGALVSQEGAAGYRLDRDAAQRVRGALRTTQKRRSSQAQQRVFRGRVRELDLDALTLIVRSPHTPDQDARMTLNDAAMLDFAREALYHGDYVSIAARRDGERGDWVALTLDYTASL